MDAASVLRVVGLLDSMDLGAFLADHAYPAADRGDATLEAVIGHLCGAVRDRALPVRYVDLVSFVVQQAVRDL
jgi:hypothetical protein